MAGRAAIQGGLPVVAFVMPLAFQLWQFVSGAGAAAAAEAEQRKKEAAEKRKASGKEGKEGEEEGEAPGEVVSDSMGAMQWAIVVLFAALYGPLPPPRASPTHPHNPPSVSICASAFELSLPCVIRSFLRGGSVLRCAAAWCGGGPGH